jgi:hypothetical protein
MTFGATSTACTLDFMIKFHSLTSIVRHSNLKPAPQTHQQSSFLSTHQFQHVQTKQTNLQTSLIPHAMQSKPEPRHMANLRPHISQYNVRDITTRYSTWQRGHAVAQLVEALRNKPEGSGFDSRWCHWNFSLTYSFRSHSGPGIDSASNRNEYQEYFLGGKGGRCVGLITLPPSCADCLEIWEPQPPGTLRASPGL